MDMHTFVGGMSSLCRIVKSAEGGSRTRNLQILSLVPLPIGLLQPKSHSRPGQGECV